MKKLLFIASIFLLSAFGYNNETPKTFAVKGTVEDWSEILRVIDFSKAEPEKRIAVREFIIKQLSDTTINKR